VTPDGPVVVPVQTSDDIAGDADVVMIGVSVGAEDVDEALRFHAPSMAGTGHRQAHEFTGAVRVWSTEGCGLRDRSREQIAETAGWSAFATPSELTMASASLWRDRLRLTVLASDVAGGAGPDEARRRRAKSGWDVGIL
jgi:hypothetical protein